MAEYLPTNPLAKQLHGEGLQAELAGDFDTADVIFAEAWQLADAKTPAGVARDVQLAHIEGDIAFNGVRRALRDGQNPTQKLRLLGVAHTKLEAAAQRTLPYVGVLSPSFSGERQNFVSKHQRREAASRHASAGGLLGRVVFSSDVLQGLVIVGQKTTPEVVAKNYHFGNAYDLARLGPNQYDATSIAMNAARTVRGYGYPANAVPWLGRATMSIFRAMARDRGNFVPAVRTMGRILSELCSQQRAIDASQSWKTV